MNSCKIIIIACFFSSALIGYEQVSYITSETEGSVDVCVTVRNGVLNSNLSVFIDLLTSTATGMYRKQKSILYSHNEKALKCKPLLFSNGIPGGHARAAVQDHVQSMCAESAASQFSFL